MYKVSVPLVRYYERFEENIAEAKRLGASRLFLCPCRATDTAEVRALHLARLRQSIPVYAQAGFEVGVWISTMGHGGALIGVSGEADEAFTHVTGLHGVTMQDSYCPSDVRFTDAVCAFLQDIVRAGAKMIMLDDDYRFSHRGDCGCVCKNHMREYAERLGEPICAQDVLAKAFKGGYSRYRQVYYDMLGDTLRNFARKMREAIDAVNPDVRFGFCAVTSSWDCDGTDAIELAKIMAGKTKPFLRLIGAPYWANNGEPTRHVQYVAELERMQAKWCEDAGIEVFAEGDCYPRPCSVTPSAYLEMFDTILRADGKADGILKYGIDYVSTPRYETGYADHAERNMPLYDQIQTRFNGKKAVGIQVTCGMKKLLDTEFADPEKQLGSTFDAAFYQTEQLLLTNCCVPSTYDDAPVVIAFGENAKHVREDAAGYILDAAAAMCLERQGIDTGIAAVFPNEKYSISRERFPTDDEVVYSDAAAGAVRMTRRGNAEICSVFAATDTNGNPVQLPSCVRYENAAGKRFLIYGYIFDRARRNTYFTRNYMRQKQLIESYAWLAGEKLPAICPKHPDLYILAKKKDGATTVGLWNIFPDAVLRPVIELDHAYSRITFLNCSGELRGDKVYLDKDIPAYTFAGFEVETS